MNALVLGAGGARGFAHMGVLRALEEAGFNPDLVVGCSMGALVGALYAMEGSSRGAERVLRDMGKRVDPRHAKQVEGYLSDYFGDARAEDMAVDFACVAVDISHKGALIFPFLARHVIFSRGPVFPGVRASIGTPLIFPVYEYGNMRLVDGGLLDPVPAGVARALGADRVMAVEVRPRPAPTRSLRRALYIQWSYARHIALRRARGASDRYLRIVLPYQGLDFHRGEDIARAGYGAARTFLEGHGAFG